MKKIKSIFAFLMLGSLTLSGCAFLDFFKSKKNDTPADTGGGGGGGGEHVEDKYTVSFDANGGTGSMSAVSEVSGEYTLPECGFTAPEGKEFNGWKIGAEGEVKQPGEKITVEADITLIAQWKDGTGPVVVKYTVTFDVQGHGQTPQSVEVDEGGKVAKPTDPSAEGWSFDGWYKEAACQNAWNFETDTVTADVTLYAKWTENAEDLLSVTFNLNGHGENYYVSVKPGEKVAKPSSDPVATGYTFGGWYKEAGCENAWDFDNDTVTEDVVIYAKWTEDTPPTPTVFTVSFNVQGHGDAPEAQNIEEGGKVTKPTDPSAENWTFGGWYKEAGCVNAWDFDADTVSAATTLYAKWTENTPEPPVVHEPPFIQHKSAEGDWVYTTLQTDPEEGKDYQYKVAELDVKAGDEFVFCVAENDWRNFDKMVAEFSSASDILEDSGDDHNFKVTEDAVLDIYIMKEAGGNVYINLHSVTPEPPVVHEPPFIQHKSAEGDWVYTTLQTDPEEGKDYQYKVAELAVKEGDEFVFCVAENDWRNFGKMAAEFSSASDILEDSGDDHNFKVTADAVLDIYIIKEAGGSVYINLHSVTPEPPVVDVHKLVINRVGEDEPIEVNLTLQSESTTEYKVEGQQLEVDDEFIMVVGTTEYKYADLKLGEGEEHVGGGVQDLFEEATDGSIKVKAAHKYNLFVETAESGKGIYTFAAYFQYQEPEGEWQTPDVSLKVDTEHEGPITEYVIGQDEPIHLKAGTKFLFRIGEKWYKYAELKEGVTGISSDEDGNLVTSVAGNYTIYCETVADDGKFIWVACEPDVVPPEETSVSLTVTRGTEETKHDLTQVGETTEYSIDGLVLEADDTIVIKVNNTEYGIDKLKTLGVSELFELKDEKFTCTEQHTYKFFVETDSDKEVEGKAIYVDCEDYFKYSNGDGTIWTTIPVSLKEGSEHEYEIPEIDLVKGAKFMFNVHDNVEDENPVRSYYKELKQSPIHNDEFDWFDTEGSDPEVLVGGTYHIFCQTPETEKETGVYITGVVDASRNYVEIIRHDDGPTDPAEHFPLQFKDEGKIFYDEFMRREALEAGDKIRFMVNGAWAELFKDEDPAADNFKAPDEEHYLEVKAECGATFDFYIALLGTGKVIWVQTYTAPVPVVHNIIFDQDWVASDDAEIYVWVWGSGIAGHWEKLEIQEALGQKYAEVTWLSSVEGFKVYRFNKAATHKPVVNDPEAEGPGDFTKDVEYWNCSTDNIVVSAETQNIHVNNVA